MSETMPSRSYTIGLPVTVTVFADCSVSYEIDWSEAAEGIEDDDSIYVDDEGNDFQYTDEEIHEDSAAVQTWVDALYKS